MRQWASQTWSLVSWLFPPMGRWVTKRKLLQLGHHSCGERERDTRDLEWLYTRRFYTVLGSGRSCGEGDNLVEACTVWVSWEAWDAGRLWFMPPWIVCTRGYCQSTGAAVLVGSSSYHCSRISPLLLIFQKKILSQTFMYSTSDSHRPRSLCPGEYSYLVFRTS